MTVNSDDHGTLPDRILRERETEWLTGLSRSTRWRLAREGKFPKPVNPSPSSKGWLLSELKQWLKERAQAREPRSTSDTGSDGA